VLTYIDVDTLRSEAVRYIQRWIGTPYRWAGIDCSGLMHEALQSVGLEKNGYDCTANQLYLNFKNGRIVKQTEEMPYVLHGCLVFWFTGGGRAYHVAMTINEFQVCEAAGGDSDTITEEDAIKANAYVRVRRLNNRGVNYKIVDPFKGWEG